MTREAHDFVELIREGFVDLILTHCEPDGDDAGESILAEFDRLTAINADLLAALEEIEAAGRYSRTGTKAAYMGNVARAAIARAKKG